MINKEKVYHGDIWALSEENNRKFYKYSCAIICGYHHFLGKNYFKAFCLNKRADKESKILWLQEKDLYFKYSHIPDKATIENKVVELFGKDAKPRNGATEKEKLRFVVFDCPSKGCYAPLMMTDFNYDVACATGKNFRVLCRGSEKKCNKYLEDKYGIKPY